MCVYAAPDSPMPRINIYITDELHLALRSHPGEINVSNVCADALRAELSGRSATRSIDWLFTSAFDAPSALDGKLKRRFGLRAAIAGETWGSESPSDIVAMTASTFLNRTLSEGLHL